MSLLNHSHIVDYSDSESDRGLPPVHKKEPRTPVTAKKIGAIKRRPEEPIVVNGYAVERPTIALATLAAMPTINIVELRNDFEFVDLHFEKKYNAESYLIISRGIEQEQPCTRCQNGRGPYKKCIRVPDQCTGACGNCTYGSNMGRCSCREDLDPPEVAVDIEPRKRVPKRKVPEPVPDHKAPARPKPKKRVKHPQDGNYVPRKKPQYDLDEPLDDDDDDDDNAPAPVVSDFPKEPRTQLDVEGAIEEAQGLGQDQLLQVREVQALRMAILDREIAARRFADADSVLTGYTKKGV